MKIIAEATGYLSDEHAADADQVLAVSAADLTYGRLRHAAARLVMMLDPEAARRRKEAAGKNARVMCFREEAGTAGLSGRDLPVGETLASWASVKARAVGYRAAGMAGTVTELRARAFLDLLQERDARDRLDVPGGQQPAAATTGGVPGTPGDGGTPGTSGTPDTPATPGTPGTNPAGGRAPAGENPGPSEPSEDGGTGGGNGETGDHRSARDTGSTGDGGGSGDGGTGGGSTGPRPAPAAPPGSGAARAPARPPLAALINITIPLATLLGTGAAPGDAAGFGLLDPAAARDLAATASHHPATRWCVTLTGHDGTATAHGCAPGQHPYHPGQHPAAGGTGGGSGAPGGNGQNGGDRPGNCRDGPPAPADGSQAAEFLRRLRAELAPIAKTTCDHASYKPGYRPSRTLRHLITARTARCHFFGCARPAAECDADHTVPWPAGPTCQCNLGPPCRHHHRCKQDPGWTLQQPEPGVMIWTGPSGRQHVTRPTTYW
ncbi:MAG: HNH endonuclease [Streptosporangiaceae bacterium]|nr:HNH endonuclease [Streptosporangiaceae bacterium]